VFARCTQLYHKGAAQFNCTLAPLSSLTTGNSPSYLPARNYVVRLTIFSTR